LLVASLLAASASLAEGGPPAVLDRAAMVKMLQTIDERTHSAGDYKALVYMEQKEKGQLDTAREALVYRRDKDEKLMIVFSKPKSEQGKGYLRLGMNLWTYDPGAGKWERRTERERIAGTDSRRADFDQSHLATEYEPTFEGTEKLGAFTVHRLSLTAKPEVDLAYPVMKLWLDASTGNTLKRQDFALSKRLMRTIYYPKWDKMFSESKKGDIWFAREIRIYNEVEKGSSTLLVLRTVDLRPLKENVFTKAWLEGQMR
jgi:hypothetical protein